MAQIGSVKMEKMKYTDEEYAKECLPLQVKHAEKVVKLLDDK